MEDSNSRPNPRYRLTEEQICEVERIQQQLRDGTATFATDEQMDTFWKRCGI
jgi:hypothetical protein